MKIKCPLLAFFFTLCSIANAQIVYHDVNPDYFCGSSNCTYSIDLNGDGITDFTLKHTQIFHACGCVNSVLLDTISITPAAGNAAAISNGNLTSILNAGQAIDASHSYSANQSLLAFTTPQCLYDCNQVQQGNWSYTFDKYLALQITVGGNNYYGWARLEAYAYAYNFTIKDFAYNSSANQAIIAGQTCAPLPTTTQSNITAGGATTFCSGGSVALTVAVSGFTYQWMKDGASISGATSQSYNASQTGTYNCNVSNSCGTTISNSISVTVNTAPTSAQAKISASGPTGFCTGGSVSLSVATPGLIYQWKKDGSNISEATLQNYTATLAASYKCDVSNNCGTTLSNSISVTVYTAPPTSGEATITAGGATSFCPGGKVVLSVATSGLTYQWKKNGANISGATKKNYTANSAGSYTCNVSNPCGTTLSNSISVTVNTEPTATVTQSPCSGGAIVLTCTANPNTGVTYQWKKGTTILSGATNSTYTATQNGTYKCTVTITSTGCNKTSNGSKVTINCKLGQSTVSSFAEIYPNPSNGNFTVDVKLHGEENEIALITVINTLGETVFTQTATVSNGEMKEEISLSNHFLSSGIYFINVTVGEQQDISKVVVE